MSGLRVAVVNQLHGGGAATVAHQASDWGPRLGLVVEQFPGSQDAATLDGLLSGLDALRPDVVHVHCWYGTYPYEALQRVAERWPTVLTLHDPFVVNQFGLECWECFRNPWCLGCPGLAWTRRWRPNHRVVARWKKRRINRRTSVHLVFPSEWMKRRVARTEWGRCPSTVIHNAVDLSAFDVPPLRVEGRPPVALFVGNMYSPDDHRKGLPDLLVAWRRVRDAVPAAVLKVVGRVVGATDGDGVDLVGEVSEGRVRELLQDADLFVLPTRGENFPMTVLEAMASGLPVVATRVGGIPEQVVHGATGALVTPGDPASLAEALVDLFRDPARLRRWGLAGRQRAEELFGLERTAERHLAVYRQVGGPPKK